MNMTTAVATAYINADVAKRQSDNARITVNDALQDTKIVEAVAGVGLAAAESTGLMVHGDNYTLSDSASISQDQVSMWKRQQLQRKQRKLHRLAR